MTEETCENCGLEEKQHPIYICEKFKAPQNHSPELKECVNELVKWNETSKRLAEKTLSEKRQSNFDVGGGERETYVYPEKDVKNFIKEVKDFLPSKFHLIIDKLAGKNLI